MRKNWHILLIFCWACLLAACSEDSLEPDFRDITAYFRPADADKSQEAELRRSFYNETGSYLLFNDTLQHKYLGIDFNGDSTYQTELLQIEYSTGSYYTGETTYKYTLLPNYDRQLEAVNFMKENILCHIQGKMAPFSWLLVDKISCVTGTATTNAYCITGQRCIAVACYMMPKLTESSRKQFVQQIMSTIIEQLIQNNADAFTQFLAICENLYGGSFSYDGTSAGNTLVLNQSGFTVRGKDYGISTNGLYPDAELDLTAYARLAILYSQEEMQQKYGDYPIILRKYNLMRETMQSLGYKF